MANIRIKDLSTTASTTASDDFFGVDGSTNGTRKLDAYSPTFGGNLTVSGTGTSSVAGKLAVGITSTSSVMEGYTASAISGADGLTNLRLSYKGGPNAGDGGAQITFAQQYTAAQPDTLIRVGGIRGIKTIGTGSFGGGVQLLYQTGAAVDMSVGATLNSSGNFLLGTTTDGGQKLQVAGSASITGAVSIGTQLNFDTGNAAGTRTIALGSTFNAGTWVILNGSTEIGSISAAGGFKSNVGFRATVGSGPTTADYGWASSSGFYSPSANVVSLTANNARVASWSTTAMTLDYTTASTSTTTGALVVSGGVGVAGAINVGGAIAIGNTVNTVSPTSPNRTITMVIGGTTYYIHAKTTND